MIERTEKPGSSVGCQCLDFIIDVFSYLLEISNIQAMAYSNSNCFHREFESEFPGELEPGFCFGFVSEQSQRR